MTSINYLTEQFDGHLECSLVFVLSTQVLLVKSFNIFIEDRTQICVSFNYFRHSHCIQFLPVQLIYFAEFLTSFSLWTIFVSTINSLFVAVKNKFKKEDDINAGDLKFNVSNIRDNSSDEEESQEKDIKEEKEEKPPTDPTPQTVCWYLQMLLYD